MLVTIYDKINFMVNIVSFCAHIWAFIRRISLTHTHRSAYIAPQPVEVRSDPSVDTDAKRLTAGSAVTDHAQLEHPLPLAQDHRTAGVVLAGVLAPAASIVGAQVAGSYAGVEATPADGIVHGQQGGLLQSVRLGGSEAQGSPTHDVHVLVVEAVLPVRKSNFTITRL